MEELHIGKMIQAELKAQERSVTWLANHIPCHRTNVYKIFSNGNIDLKCSPVSLKCWTIIS